MIIGKVKRGAGKASKISEEIFLMRCTVAGVKLERGTLNIDVSDLTASVTALGVPHFETDKDNKKLGPLRWWKVGLSAKHISPGGEVFVVRHYNTSTPYIEIMGEDNFRSLGLTDGDEVKIRLQPNHLKYRK